MAAGHGGALRPLGDATLRGGEVLREAARGEGASRGAARAAATGMLEETSVPCGRLGLARAWLGFGFGFWFGLGLGFGLGFG